MERFHRTVFNLNLAQALKGKRLPTISDVARRAGVSPATVSRVIQGAKNVNPDTRERVQGAIEELGFVPSAVARSLRSKRTRSLALIVSDVTNTFWTTVARGVEDVAQRHGYSVLLCNSDENLAKQDQYLDFLIGQQVDGVIIAPFDADSRHLDKLRRRKIPTVIVDRRVDGWDMDSVGSDSLSGARALVQHLIGLDHRCIAVISGPAITSTAEDRVAGYCMALAEAGIPLDPRLIKRGEYRNATGKDFTHELLDDGLEPTAIFAANNLIAMGVIDAVEERGLQIPQDLALVCFDDLPNASHLFPFLTVVAQPVYDLGMNAAQLLLSRLESQVPLQPRQVVLPVRLIVRHSCGSRLTQNGDCPLSLPIPQNDVGGSTMVRSITTEERRDLSRYLEGVSTPVPSGLERLADYDQSNVNRLLKALQHQEADRVPHLELLVSSRAVYEYVLEHELEENMSIVEIAGLPIAPEDHVEFALRLGMDAVPCHFAWQPRTSDPDGLEPPPSLAEQLSYLERYLRAALGTGVGVIASFTSFFGSALQAAGLTNAINQFGDRQQSIDPLMDRLLARQEQVMRAVCDRFADDLALVMVQEHLANYHGLIIDREAFLTVFPWRMERLVAPAQEHNKLLLMHTRGSLDEVLPVLADMGFHAIHPVEPEWNDIVEIKNKWADRLALVGNVPTSLLAGGTKDQIEAAVRERCLSLAPGGGYVLSSSGRITSDIPPESFVTISRAVHKYGRYGSLGREV
jgi:LacI family transcriptional regulator